MEIIAHHLNAFAKTPTGGNPAGVVLNADALSPVEMQKIAAEIGFSEIAFVQQSDKADFKVRFFTPETEIELCGHATIATFSLLALKQILKPGSYTFETQAGVLGIEIREDETVFMEQLLPQFFEKLEGKDIARSLNIDPAMIHPKLPIQIVSTGVRDILIPVLSEAALLSIRPDLDEIARICKVNNAVGYHVFTLEAKHNATAQCRDFAPLVGIDEEAATGTSSGALACYLFHHSELNADQAQHVVFEQGYSMNRPSEILCKLDTENMTIRSVKVGGRAIVQKEITISLT